MRTSLLTSLPVVCIAAAVAFFALGGRECQCAESGMISLNFTGDVDLREFVRYVSKSTGKTFIFDRNFTGTVMFLGPGQIPEEDLFWFLEVLLEVGGFALEPVGEDVIKVRKADQVGGKPMPLFLPDELAALPDSDAMITLAYKLRYVGVPEMKTSIAPLVAAGRGALVYFERANMIIITDYTRNVKRIVKVLEWVDNEENIPQVVIRTLVWASAENVGQRIKKVIATESKLLALPQTRQPDVDFDVSSNSIILVATPPEMDKLMELIDSLDVEPDDRGRTWKMYRLKNAKAVDVADTLKALVQGAPSGVRARPPARPARGAGQPRAPQAGIGMLASAEIRVIEYEAQNSIIVVAPREIQSEMAELITELDVFKPQVSIEALIVQVASGTDLDLGVELAYWQNDKNYNGIGVTNFDFSEYDFDTGMTTIKPGLGLTSVLLHDDQVPILIRALRIENRGKIISRPVILANDNAKATFESVDQQPYTSVNTLTSTTATTSFGGFEEAGTRLIITPHISEGDYLSLEIELELSQFTGVATSAGVPPAKRTDRLETEITVPNNSTIVIGGLSGYHSTHTVSKVPILGDIPLLGLLFRRTVTVHDDSTEYIFIKARIARDEGFRDLLEMSREPRKDALELEATMESRTEGDVERMLGAEGRATRVGE